MGQARDEAGNIWEVDAQGNPVRLISQGAPQMPADPTFQFEAPKAAADLANTQDTIDDRNRDNARADAALQLQREQFAFQKEQAAKGKSAPDPMKLAQFRALEEQIARVEELYRAGPGSTQGASSIKDYLPTDANAAFDSAAAGLGEVGLAAFRVPGVGSQSDAELRQFVAANTPSASDRDTAIQEKLGNLRRRLNATRQELGIESSKPNAMTYARTDGGRTNTLNVAGGNLKAVPYPDEGSQRHDAMVASLMAANGGRLDPQAYARARSELDREYGMQGDPGAYAAWANSINSYLDAGGSTVPTGIQATNEEMSALDLSRHGMVNNPIGAGVAGGLNSLTVGAPEALAGGGQMDALREEFPMSTLGGEMVGAIGGTGAIGFAGRRGLAALGRQGLQNQFGRNLAADATYGGLYGGMTEGDPLTGAALGAAGSALGQGVGRVASDAVGGVRLGEAAQRLRDRGVRLTAGRILGDKASRIEDKMVSLPFAGDMVRRRQSEAFQDFNRAAFKEGGSPIGYASDAIGDEGVNRFRGAVGDAYDNATAGVTVPFDGQFMADMGQVYAGAQRMPQDRFNALGEIVDARVGHLHDRGVMTGPDYQQAMRALKQNRSNVPGQFAGFEQEYRDGVTGVMGALEGNMRRGGGDSVIAGLDAANAANKNLKILENASLDKAKVGAQTGEAEVFLPSQLIAAARQSERKFGPSTLKQLGKDGQEVLPSTVPNSGTADRIAMMGLGLGGLGAAGAGETYATGDASTTTKAATALAVLTALGTRRGQDAIEAIALDRPDALKKFGEVMRRRKGLFGSAANPLAQQVND